MEITKEQEEAVTREIDAHGDRLKTAIENCRCPRCGDDIRPELNERNITFKCDATIAECGWSAIYPIRTIGNSERAQQDEALDSIATSEHEVLNAAKKWARQVVNTGTVLSSERELVDAIILLEAREAMKATEHLDVEATGRIERP